MKMIATTRLNKAQAGEAHSHRWKELLVLEYTDWTTSPLPLCSCLRTRNALSISRPIVLKLLPLLLFNVNAHNQP